MSEFKERICELRKQRELTQQELATIIGVNKQTISQYERGVRRPDFDILSVLCDYFNVSTDYMLGKVDVTMRYLNSEELAQLERKGQLTLSPDEASLLDDYQKLNQTGKRKAREDVHDLTEIQRYTEKGKDDGPAGDTLVS